MLTPESPSTRPSRLPALGQLAIALLLFGSFASGVLIWWGQTVQAREMITPGWLRPASVLHGALNPLLCILFGYLLCHHIRVGWQLRANLLTGFLMEGVFAGLILTGVGMYYLGEEWRKTAVWAHRSMGLLLPLALGSHWFAGLAWAKRITQSR